jgi:hypothetical protein
VQTAVNAGSQPLIFVRRAAHSHDLSLRVKSCCMRYILQFSLDISVQRPGAAVF